MLTSPSSTRYLELLKRSLIDHQNIGTHEYHPLAIVEPNWRTAFLFPIDRLLRTRSFAICKVKSVIGPQRMGGLDWPANAPTMIGMERLNNIEECVRTIARDGIPGDLLEAGVWRGGAAIFMRALLRELALEGRCVWLADSFQGLPVPDTTIHPADQGNELHELKILRVGLDEVRANFERYGLLDERVCFLKGWFKDTLPGAPVSKLALLRLDADTYGSTSVAISSLYPKLAVGGFVIVDDYHAVPACRQAVDDFRSRQHIEDELRPIDQEAIYWRRSA